MAVAQLSAGLDDPTAAARAFEVYATQYAPASPEEGSGLLVQEEAFWEARNYWRVAGEAQLRSFYERYIRVNFAAPNLSHQVLAWDALATSADKAGKKREAQAARDKDRKSHV